MHSEKFPLGKTCITPAALEALILVDFKAELRRHARGDWGDVSPEGWAGNDLSVKEGRRVISEYRDIEGTRFWIITESDRSVTTILLPSEY